MLKNEGDSDPLVVERIQANQPNLGACKNPLAPRAPNAPQQRVAILNSLLKLGHTKTRRLRSPTKRSKKVASPTKMATTQLPHSQTAQHRWSVIRLRISGKTLAQTIPYPFFPSRHQIQTPLEGVAHRRWSVRYILGMARQHRRRTGRGKADLNGSRKPRRRPRRAGRMSRLSVSPAWPVGIGPCTC